MIWGTIYPTACFLRLAAGGASNTYWLAAPDEPTPDYSAVGDLRRGPPATATLAANCTRAATGRVSVSVALSAASLLVDATFRVSQGGEALWPVWSDTPQDLLLRPGETRRQVLAVRPNAAASPISLVVDLRAFNMPAGVAASVTCGDAEDPPPGWAL